MQLNQSVYPKGHKNPRCRKRWPECSIIFLAPRYKNVAHVVIAESISEAPNANAAYDEKYPAHISE
jgi:hypothetical protein